MEIVKLQYPHNLASEHERNHLKSVYKNEGVMKQGPVVNFIVWRRSVLLVLLLASLGSFIFCLIGDVLTINGHIKNMQQFSTWNASYSEWKRQTVAGLKEIDCQEIDIHFHSVLSSYGVSHEVLATSCPEIMKHGGIRCEDHVDKVIVGCWQPGFCQETISYNCPHACKASRHNPTGNWCRDTRDARLDYTSFSLDFTKAMLYKIMEQFTRVELYKIIVSGIGKFAAVILTFNACLRWEDLPRSRWMLVLAWAVTFSAPFLRSVVPTPFLIDWAGIDVELKAYVQATDHHFELSTRMQNVSKMAGKACHSDVMEQRLHNTWKETHHKVHYWCGQVQSSTSWFPWSDLLKRGAQQCQVLTNYMGMGDVAAGETWKQKEKLCGKINETETNVTLDIDTVKEVVDGLLQNSAYTASGLYSGLLSFQVLLPAAFSVAPGLLTAALRIKLVAPQSHLPGVFIVVMPLMYVPLVWACGVIAVQSIGEILVLVALACVALSPAVYTVFGIARAVTSPMSRTDVLCFCKTVEKCTTIFKSVALLCFVIYMRKIYSRIQEQIQEIEESKEGLAAFALEQARKVLLPLLLGEVTNLKSLLYSGVVWSMLFTFTTAMFLTTVVGADWMMRTTVEEWQGWRYQSQYRFHGKSPEQLYREQVSAATAMLLVTQEQTLGSDVP